MSRKKLFQNIQDTIQLPKERKDQHILLKQVQHIQVNGLEGSEMDKEFKFGQMEHDIRDNGKIIELMVMDSLFMLMGTFMKETGLMIKLMALVSIFM